MKNYLFIFFIFTSLSLASIYEQTDKHGNVMYTDIPTGPAKKIEISNGNKTSKPVEPPTIVMPENKTNESSNSNYTSFEITSPIDQQTFQNQQTIEIKLKIQPELKKGDKVRAIIDGKQTESVAASTITIKELDRGTHQLSAQLLDEKNSVIKNSNSITIFIHYNSTNMPSPKR